MSTYTVFLQPAITGYSAHVPGRPGCVAAASTLEDTRQLKREAIEFHVEGMRMNGEVVPTVGDAGQPSSTPAEITATAAKPSSLDGI